MKPNPPPLKTPQTQNASASTSAKANPQWQVLDYLITLVAVVRFDGQVLYANAALEDAIGMSRRTIEAVDFADFFVDPSPFRQAISGARENAFAAIRYEGMLKRVSHDAVPVHVIVAQGMQPNEALVELLPLEQQAKQEREERLVDQALANKELIRNLAHEIKNPLGGIRGAAQLLEMDIHSKELNEYTQVIIHEADRLQTLVDRGGRHRVGHTIAPGCHDAPRLRPALVPLVPHHRSEVPARLVG